MPQLRRLIQAPFLDLLHQCLKPGGRVHLATDWEDYAQDMMGLFSNHPDFENHAGPGGFVTGADYRPSTKFERRGINLGHGVWDMIFCAKNT